MTRVFIDGAAGTTGLEIESRLTGRPEFDLVRLDDAHRKDAGARRDALNAADVVILCLPDDAAREAVALIDNPATRVIDASTAHRTAKGWTFGFPELVGRDIVAQAKRVSNPGCYSTGFIALVAPLVRASLIGGGARLSCYAVSGYSGGGKAMIAEFESGAAPTAWRTYALSLAHKHVPEMLRHSGLTHAPLFAPSVAATHRGMIVDIPLFGVDAAKARDTLSWFYEGSKIVRVREFDEANLTIEHMAGRDGLELFVFGNAEGTQCRLVAALDNLGKGASGAAVQSLNLMAGLPEETGLRV
ncbi:N-acetyl-gamma-glutamyl-phosphate reductase [Sphingomonas sp. SUN039]|uniref:N-acetyl-gamma-glutamyl-phosphate reductase n=1 Tax=Sphingomonas sp. SUN039 TaxID=2937787 RepID=UPI00216405F2|nr:N-acetyl-gamma-glutamyl-phosphate reductase [Sphingomonas sp. SUN039]UVO52940.1 N-acetyl-gamma-glutamyl-phosphate reductase [Sphingomonas sp. SUN039]